FVLEVLDTSAIPFSCVAQVTVSALQIQLVGLQIVRGLLVEARLLIGSQFRLERGRDLQSHVRLDREDIGEPTVVRLGPEVSVRFCVETYDRRRSEEHTSELQSRSDLVCRLLLEKKNKHLAGREPLGLPD